MERRLGILLLALALLGCAVPALACSPLPMPDESGFSRHDVGHLPRNAQGVVFELLGKKKPKVAYFSITSPDDKRPLRLRLRTFKKWGWVRLEPVGGFQPNAHYEFRYLPAHDKWSNPDRMSVTIDDVVVDTAGTYAIELAPRPEYRVIRVPGSAGCTQSVVAVVQAFGYRVPASLDRYRAHLEYWAGVRRPPGQEQRVAETHDWPFKPDPYYYGAVWPFYGEIDSNYSIRDNAIVAGCDRQPLRGTLAAGIAFPEVDNAWHDPAPVPFDLGHNAVGACRPFDALARTMQAFGPARGLVSVCNFPLLPPYGAKPEDLRHIAIDDWEQELTSLYDLSASCNLATLAYLWNPRQIPLDDNTMKRLGTALAKGLHQVEAPVLQQTVDGLQYVVQQLPADRQAKAAPALLAPLQAELAAALAERAPYRPDVVASLLVRSGRLARAVQPTVQAVAQGRTAAAPHARAALAALGVGQPRK